MEPSLIKRIEENAVVPYIDLKVDYIESSAFVCHSGRRHHLSLCYKNERRSNGS